MYRIETDAVQWKQSLSSSVGLTSAENEVFHSRILNSILLVSNEVVLLNSS